MPVRRTQVDAPLEEQDLLPQQAHPPSVATASSGSDRRGCCAAKRATGLATPGVSPGLKLGRRFTLLRPVDAFYSGVDNREAIALDPQAAPRVSLKDQADGCRQCHFLIQKLN
jgi:hypothetical protein